jgi:hypothetical protein
VRKPVRIWSNRWTDETYEAREGDVFSHRCQPIYYSIGDWYTRLLKNLLYRSRAAHEEPGRE